MDEEYESVCSICLDPCRGKALTNPCLHEFCYVCIVKWSKVKPECPLCKRLLSSIIHNIKGDDNYEERLIPQASTTAEYQTNNGGGNAIRPHIFCPICNRHCWSGDVLAVHLQTYHNEHLIASSEPRAVITSRAPAAQQNAYQRTSRPPYAQQNANQSTSRPPYIQQNAYQSTSRPHYVQQNAYQSTSRPSYVQQNANQSTSRPPYVQQNAYQSTSRPPYAQQNANQITSRPPYAQKNANQSTSRPPYAQQNAYQSTFRTPYAQQHVPNASGISNDFVLASAATTSRAPSQTSVSSHGPSNAYTCNLCGKMCASGAGLASHMRAHSRRAVEIPADDTH